MKISEIVVEAGENLFKVPYQELKQRYASETDPAQKEKIKQVMDKKVAYAKSKSPAPAPTAPRQKTSYRYGERVRRPDNKGSRIVGEFDGEPVTYGDIIMNRGLLRRIDRVIDMDLFTTLGGV